MDVDDKNGQICNRKHFEVVINIRGESQIFYKVFYEIFYEIFYKVFAFLVTCINGLGYTPTKQVNNQLSMGFRLSIDWCTKPIEEFGHFKSI